MNEQYLHPVLSFKDDAIRPRLGNDSSLIEVKQTTEDDFIISVVLKIDNAYIESLIASKRAVYAVEIFCSDTMYREMYTRFDNHFQIAISRKNVFSTVMVKPFVFLTEDFEYCNPCANEDFDGVTFPLSKGDILVEFRGISFKAELTYTMDSIFNFRSNIDSPEEKLVKYQLTEDKIRILLPPNDYLIFKGRKDDDEARKALISSLVLNALLYALYEGDFKDAEKDSDPIWKKSIRETVELRHPNFDWKNAKYADLAQELLENPISSLFDEIQNSSNS